MPLRTSFGDIVLAAGCLLTLIGLMLLFRASTSRRSRPFSSALFGLGCALAFAGLLTTLLPLLGNAQTQLVLGAFRESSPNPIVRLMNRAVCYALEHSGRVLAVGVLMLVVGLILLCRSPKGRESKAEQPLARTRPVQAAAPLWEVESTSAHQPNPFADLAQWARDDNRSTYAPSKSTTVFASFSEPMLERNHLYTAVPEAQTQRAEKPAPLLPPNVVYPLQSAPMADMPIARAVSADTPRNTSSAPTLPPASQIDINDEEMLKKYFASNEEQSEPQMMSSRIRSTIGRHRE